MAAMHQEVGLSVPSLNDVEIASLGPAEVGLADPVTELLAGHGAADHRLELVVAGEVVVGAAVVVGGSVVVVVEKRPDVGHRHAERTVSENRLQAVLFLFSVPPVPV